MKQNRILKILIAIHIFCGTYFILAIVLGQGRLWYNILFVFINLAGIAVNLNTIRMIKIINN